MCVVGHCTQAFLPLENLRRRSEEMSQAIATRVMEETEEAVKLSYLNDHHSEDGKCIFSNSTHQLPLKAVPP
jgi:hypothetical protein